MHTDSNLFPDTAGSMATVVRTDGMSTTPVIAWVWRDTSFRPVVNLPGDDTARVLNASRGDRYVIWSQHPDRDGPTTKAEAERVLRNRGMGS